MNNASNWWHHHVVISKGKNDCKVHKKNTRLDRSTHCANTESTSTSYFRGTSYCSAAVFRCQRLPIRNPPWAQVLITSHNIHCCDSNEFSLKDMLNDLIWSIWWISGDHPPIFQSIGIVPKGIGSGSSNFGMQNDLFPMVLFWRILHSCPAPSGFAELQFPKFYSQIFNAHFAHKTTSNFHSSTSSFHVPASTRSARRGAVTNAAVPSCLSATRQWRPPQDLGEKMEAKQQPTKNPS